MRWRIWSGSSRRWGGGISRDRRAIFRTLHETQVKAALRHNAAAVIVAHNHPSGSIKPSSADRYITRRLRTALALVDVHLLDHILIAGTHAAHIKA